MHIFCVDKRFLDISFPGRTYDERFLSDNPASVDTCGEYSEFHTFVYDGTVFKQARPYSKGEITCREYEDSSFNSGFWNFDVTGDQ